MARKNLIEVSSTHAPKTEAHTSFDNRPIAGFVPTTRNAVPVGGITRTLGNITEKMERAEKMERQMAEGQTVLDLDPSVVDGSFVNDRMTIDETELAQLVEQIRDHGQQVPILVRPHPNAKGRFQVAYGHRRLAAIKQLGIKVRAVVRDLSDDQLVISQGQENNARTNLSYIERALFASRLEGRDFTRDIIMSALGVDKAALSKMLLIIRQVPIELITAIGAAPEIGRRRWLELGEHINDRSNEDLLALLATEPLRRMSSDERFHRVLSTVTKKNSAPEAREVFNLSADLPVQIKRTGSGSTFVFNSKAAPGFDEFVKERLIGLFAEFKQNQGD
jgi:ParB family chromosome partitioning protein